MGLERRINLRMPVVWKATVTRLNGEQLPGSTDNVSHDGLNVILPKTLVIGEPVKVSIVTLCHGQTCWFELDGVAVYAKPLDERLGTAVGLRLLEPEARFNALLNGLAEDTLAASG